MMIVTTVIVMGYQHEGLLQLNSAMKTCKRERSLNTGLCGWYVEGSAFFACAHHGPDCRSCSFFEAQSRNFV